MAPRTWLITGASRGLGRAFVDGVLAHGDRVIATARAPEALERELEGYGDQVLVLPLDVNDSVAARSVVETALGVMGQIDVLVNNAGYGLAGGIEEVSAAEIRSQFETNFFGTLWVIRAVLPHMRNRGTGHIIQISSIAGITASPNIGIYAASKWALEAMSEALAGEVGPLGIKVTIVEPSGFRTDWSGSSMVRATTMNEYDDVLGARREMFSGAPLPTATAGDPALAAERLIEIVECPDPPLRLLLGNMAFDLATTTYQRTTAGLS